MNTRVIAVHADADEDFQVGKAPPILSTHMCNACETYNVFYSGDQRLWQQQNQTLYVYWNMRSGLERETPGSDAPGTSKERKILVSKGM